MRTSLKKLRQAAPQPGGGPPQSKESSFTEADFATAIHSFIVGMNDFNKIGMIKTDTPALLSGAIGLATSILLATPGSNYMQRELQLGASKSATSSGRVSPSVGDLFTSFSTRVSSKITAAFAKFNSLMKYSEELLEGKNISADPAKAAEYEKQKHIILRSISSSDSLSIGELKSNLYQLIDNISECLDNINKASGTNFSIIKQFLNLDPAVSTGIDIDEDTLSTKKYDLNNLPQNLISQLSDLLKELKNLSILVSIANSISSNFPSVSSIPIGGSSAKPTSGQGSTASGGRQTTTTSSTSSTFFIDSIKNLVDFTFDGATNSLKLSSFTASSQPSFTLAIVCQTPNLQPYDLFSMIYRPGLLKISDPSRLTNPPPAISQALNQVRDIISNPSSNNLNLEISPNSAISGYDLKISLPTHIAAQLSLHKGFQIFTIQTKSSTIMVKSGTNLYSLESGISKIYFKTNDLINDSSNISKVDRQKILNKLKQ
jgi:hypothetical protein